MNGLKETAEELKANGWGVIPPEQFLIDMEDDFKVLWEMVKPFTLISVERGYSLYKSIEYIVKNEIPGVFIECGVWKGGSCLLMALTLEKMNIYNRKIYLYDTFDGMSEPTEEDVIAWNGKPVYEKWKRDDFASWTVDETTVREVLRLSNLSPETFVFVKGDVEQTLEETVPREIALLRLDTDWYASTAKELKVLYPLLSSGGVLLIDDYGHFEGARKAVDEYFYDKPILLSRVDYTGRQGVKM